MAKKGKKGADEVEQNETQIQSSYPDESQAEVEAHVIKMQNQLLRERIGRLELRVGELSRQCEDLTMQLRTEGDEHNHAMSKIMRELKEKEEEVFKLQDRIIHTEEEKKMAIISQEALLETTRHEAERSIKDIQDQFSTYVEELKDLQEFKVHKIEIESELENVVKKAAEEKKDHMRAIADQERKSLQEKDRLRKEMLGKVKEARNTMLKMTDSQLASTTKQTMIENEQMSIELAYQSKISKEILQNYQKVKEECSQMKMHIKLLEDEVSKYAQRSSSAQKVISMLVQKVRLLDSELKAVSTNIEDRKDSEIRSLIQELDLRGEKIADLTRQIDFMQKGGQLNMDITHQSEHQKGIVSAINDAVQAVLSSMHGMKGATPTNLGSIHEVPQAIDEEEIHRPILPPLNASLVEQEDALRGILSRLNHLPYPESLVGSESNSTTLPPIITKAGGSKVSGERNVPNGKRNTSGISSPKGIKSEYRNIGIQTENRAPGYLRTTQDAQPSGTDAISILEALSSPSRNFGKKLDDVKGQHQSPDTIKRKGVPPGQQRATHQPGAVQSTVNHTIH